MGVSTGGFSDCVLKLGATRVIGVEVGHGQTVKQLLENPRFQLFEGINARYLSTYTELISKFPQDGFDFIDEQIRMNGKPDTEDLNEMSKNLLVMNDKWEKYKEVISKS